MSSRKKVAPANFSGPLPYPIESSFTSEQARATAEHVLAIHNWVPVERVVDLVNELIELADEYGCKIIVNEDGSEQAWQGDEAQAGVFALLAARLIEVYKLDVSAPTN